MSTFKIVKLVGQGLNNTVITGGLVPKGAYNAATDYAVGDSVDYNGSSYVMFSDAPANTLPTDTTYWQVLAEKGDNGQGVPTGGTAGQVLAKIDATDYNTEWVAQTGGEGGGTSRNIASISTNTNAGAAATTDYVYLCSAALTLTLPTAVGNTNLYTVKRTGSGTVTIATTSAQTIDGGSTAVLSSQYESVSVVSDDSNWNII